MSNGGCVTLDEVFAAAGARRASIVPETSGYLALAIGDAISRLPFALDDRAVMLTTEGTVSVTRRGEVVTARQAARGLRDILSRLLTVSAGTMRGLVGAARPRDESDRGVEVVVEEIEAALIPVNRAAARRALARLARETLKAKESGKLKPRAASRPAIEPARAPEPVGAIEPEKRQIVADSGEAAKVTEAPKAAVVDAPKAVAEPVAPMFVEAPVMTFELADGASMASAEEHEPIVTFDLDYAVAIPPPAHEPVDVVPIFLAPIAGEPASEAAPPEPVEVARIVDIVEAAQLEPVEIIESAPPVPVEIAEAAPPEAPSFSETPEGDPWADAPAASPEPTPTVLGMAAVEIDGPPPEVEPRTEIDAAVAPVREELPPHLEAIRRATSARAIASPMTPPFAMGAPPTRADDLVARFGMSCGSDDGMREAAACLKKMAGLEPTPPPQVAQQRIPALPTPAPPIRATSERTIWESSPAPPRVARRRSGAGFGLTLAVLFSGVVAGGALVRWHPEVLAAVSARLAPAPRPAAAPVIPTTADERASRPAAPAAAPPPAKAAPADALPAEPKPASAEVPATPPAEPARSERPGSKRAERGNGGRSR